MAGLVPTIHVLGFARKTWMPGIKPGMTMETQCLYFAIHVLCQAFKQILPVRILPVN